MHDLPWFQRYSIRSKLLARETPPSARLLSDDDRLVSTQPLPLPGFRPTAVLGAPGCGKSTFVSDIALAELKLPRSAPVILLRLRISAAADGTSRDAPQPMQGTDELSLQICAQLGFPGRPSFLRGLLCHGVEISGNRFQLGRIPSSAERVVAALAMFFDECEKIKMEGVARGQTPLESAPLLVFDEVQGLVQNANLKNAGGQVIFDALGQGIVAYGPERCAVRVVMTGSSADVYALIEAASPRNERFVRFDLEDPTEDVMASALVRRGYSEQESRAMIAQCGTRLRLFDEPLRLGASLLSAEKFRRDAALNASEDFAELFAKFSTVDSAMLAKALDTISAQASGNSPPCEYRVKSLLPTLQLGNSRALYVNRAHILSFQSRLHSQTWPLVRSQYYSPASR